MVQPLLIFLFFLSLSSVCVVLPRAPSSSPGGAGPVWSDTRGPAGQMEAAASDVFRNLQRGQCDWLCCVHKRTKGTTRQFIMPYITVGLCLSRWWLLWVVLYCHLLEKLYNADISSLQGQVLLKIKKRAVAGSMALPVFLLYVWVQLYLSIMIVSTNCKWAWWADFKKIKWPFSKRPELSMQ